MPTQFRNIEGLARMRRLTERTTVTILKHSIKEAIKEGFKMDFLYEDTRAGNKVLSGYRSVSPAALGTHVTSGNLVLRGYLIEGVSKSKKTPKWRLWRVSRIKQFRIHYRPSKTPIGYKKDDKHIGNIITQK